MVLCEHLNEALLCESVLGASVVRVGAWSGVFVYKLLSEWGH